MKKKNESKIKFLVYKLLFVGNIDMSLLLVIKSHILGTFF